MTEDSLSVGWTLAVDFGTTSTVTAMEYADGITEILQVDGLEKMPSMVVVDNDHTVVVGTAAAQLAVSMPHRTIRTPKNRLGNGTPIVIGGTPFQAVTFVTSLLDHVLTSATRIHGQPPTRSRLTFPATWSPYERGRLLEAAITAGYPEPELLAEPTAAALTYVVDTALTTGEHVVVYDLGGGAFDTVVLRRTEGGFSVVGCPLGDAQVGGELFDEMVMNHVGKQIDASLWDQLLVSDEPEWMRAAAKLRAECKQAKETLSTKAIANVMVELPGAKIDVAISREELEHLIVPFLDESIELVDQCIADAGQTRETIAAIYVVGGASRMTLVEERVRDAFPDTVVRRQGDPKTAVALGALLAVAGSFDESMVDFCDRAGVEPLATSPGRVSPPVPPTVDVPSGPPTRMHRED